MVGKLIKHEFLDSRKSFMPVIGLIFGSTLVLTIFVKTSLQNNSMAFVNSILLLIFFGMSVAIAVMSLMAMIDLLYKSIYNKNGYRLFTLPVKSWEIVAAKIIVTFIWGIIIGLITFIAFTIFLVIVTNGVDTVKLIGSLMSYVISELELRFIAASLISFISSNIITITILLFVGSMMNSAYVQNRRGLKTFILYLVITSIVTRITAGFTLNQNTLDIIFQETVIINPGILEGFDPLVDGWHHLFTINTWVDGMQVMLKVAFLELIISGLFVFGTIWFWDNKLEVID